MITRIKIRNFKSIIEADVKLGPVNVFIGANNSGKSNFMEILGALGKIPVTPADGFFSSGRFQEVYPEFESIEASNGSVELTFFQKDASQGMSEYSVTLGQNEKEAIVFLKEYLSENNKPLFESVENNIGFAGSGRRFPLPNQFSVLMSDRGSVKNDLIVSWFNSRVYSLNPKVIKANENVPSERNAEVVIQPDGGRTALIIDDLASKKIKKHKEFMSLMRDFAPEIEEVTAPESSNRSRRIAIFEKGMEEAIGGEAISDGLAYLIAIFAVLVGKTPPRIIGIEEPENGIHPRRLQEVAVYFKRMAEKLDGGDPEIPQIVLTTHSPYLLDYFEDMPEAVIVVEREPGEGTRFTPLVEILERKRPHLQEELNKKAMSLGEMWFNGYLGGVPK